MSNIATAKFCECGSHHTEFKLRFCKRCKKSFCKEHGDLKKEFVMNVKNYEKRNF